MRKGQLELQGFFDKQREIYRSGRLEDMQAFFDEWLAKTDSEGDKAARVTILNEMMGFYRVKSIHEKAVACAEEAAGIMREIGMTGTIPYAMTLLNAATVFRAAGKYQESAERYAEVFAIFHEQLPPNDFKFAEANNNVALLYQELGRFDKAAEALERALGICRDTPHKEFQTAVTLANLGNCEAASGEYGAAIVDLTEAIEIFTEKNINDSHHAAAITGLADIDERLGKTDKAREGYLRAMEMIEGFVGQNDEYNRIREKYNSLPADDIEETDNYDGCNEDSKSGKDSSWKNVSGDTDRGFGLRLSRDFYDKLGKQMIEEKFSEYAGRIAVGKAGSGSECFGFDDSLSRDHDFGPGFSMWLTDEDYDKIGEALQKEYELILDKYISDNVGEAKDFVSSFRNERAAKRTGVRKISDFYEEHTGYPAGPEKDGDYLTCEESGLAAAVNGEVYRDDLGIFTGIREKLKKHYPEYVRFLKIANLTTMMGREGQYNLKRVSERGDYTAAGLMRSDAVKDALQLIYLLNSTYAPHEKWLRKGIDGLLHISYLGRLIDDIMLTGITETEKLVRYIEKLCFTVLRELKDQGIVWGDSTFLPDYAEAFQRKAAIYMMDVPQLAEEVAKVEFRAFDAVNNKGGRAYCQNNWPTFRIMRMSQYLTWTKEMLVQYLTDFEGVIAEGRNMITEKYGYMMETTAPEEFKAIRDKLPPVPENKKALVRELTRIETGWMEEFAAKYPRLSKNARLIHTSDDLGWDTSSETYQRGELYSYSDKMLLMYGRFVAALCREGINLTIRIMENTVKMYGYTSLEDAEEKMKG